MISMNVDFSSSAFKKALAKGKEKEVMADTFKLLAREAEEEIRKEEPVVTGWLERTTQGKYTPNSAIITTRADYWTYVNYGRHKKDGTFIINPFLSRAIGTMKAENTIGKCVDQAAKVNL